MLLLLVKIVFLASSSFLLITRFRYKLQNIQVSAMLSSGAELFKKIDYQKSSIFLLNRLFNPLNLELLELK